MAKLFHFSEDPTIRRFEPRPRPTDPGAPPIAWAIDEEHAPHYYFPRDCPRICFWARPDSLPSDVARFLGHTTARKVIAIESSWLDRVRHACLYAYHLPADGFTLVDESAGYYGSTEAVTPLSIEPMGDVLARLVDSGVDYGSPRRSGRCGTRSSPRRSTSR